MLKRIYVHNYKAFQNFELKFDDFGSSLLLGKNGSGKSSLVEVFKIFQDIGYGMSPISVLINKESFNILQANCVIRLELEIEISNTIIQYILLIDFVEDLERIRIKKEQLIVNTISVLDRNENGVLHKTKDDEVVSDFFLDWHMLALPIFNPKTQELEIVQKFKNWLSNIIVLSPIPALMGIKNERNPIKPHYYAENIGAWITHLFAIKPKSYQYMIEYLTPIFPDLEEISNEEKELRFIFRIDNHRQFLKFSQLSYGERIFVLWSAILASVKLDQISLCVWDEPENYISLLEIQHYFNTLKQTFNNKAQFIATTHNPETMRMFSTEDIFILFRKHHLEPIRLQIASELNIENDIAEMIKAGLVEL